MKILISNTSDSPLYQQIKDQIKDAILKEELVEGEVLPQLSVIIVISHVPQLCFKQLLATPSIHCTFYHF